MELRMKHVKSKTVDKTHCNCGIQTTLNHWKSYFTPRPVTRGGPSSTVVWAYGWKTEPAFACFYEFHGVKGVGWGGVGWANNVHLHTWWYATVSLLALPHIHDATLLYVFLHCLTYMMLRYCKSSCTSSHAWCYATARLLALPHIHDATLL